MRRRLLLQGAAALALATSPALRAAEGAAGFDTLDLDWTDTARQRPVPVRLHLPQQATKARPTPLFVISHGIGGSRRGYSWLGRHLASQGIACLHLQHVGSDRSLWGGSVLGLVGRLQAAAQDEEALARTEDFRFALDTLLTSEAGERIDVRRIVATGHSYGANTSLLVAGAQVQREGQPLLLVDPRVAAVVVLSAPPFYGQGEPGDILGNVKVPSLHITCTEDVIRIPGYWSDLADRLRVYEAIGSRRKWLAVFQGGAHSMFTDRNGPGGALNPQAKRASQALVTAFMHAVFEGDERALTAWPGQHADILARFQGPTA